MKPIRHYAFISTILLLLTLVSGCGNDQVEQEPQKELLVAAASDLTLAFTEVGALFEEETGVPITFSFGSTGQLADQIENGAPFDVFAAANIDFIDRLKEAELLFPDTQTTYAFGRIGVATLPNSTTSVETLDDLLNPEIKKIAIANPDHAPYGLAAKEALETAGIWDQVEEKLVYGRNISDTLSYIETGNAEAGIIALSLYQEGEVDFELIDADLHEPLEQSIAVINRTNEEELARMFIEFITGPIGKPIMESYGFIVPEETE
ncbi:molybdate ABC transporter substrate-binding protein [Halalkalibacter okhensis]|uniref:Molybdenum ABC transporter substrate-binding protein n=1 Tax=Halalkalibacter okhensis TaxID=333138 RepID=A0A0B0IKD7_9BACI|nr:molybdate ABC transporter substrate-binding protein [Halalkalibacter okhensis]KHF40136.1 molybdenum ABC transporter substrate-binding protein [Halalkalibacter okhensis]